MAACVQERAYIQNTLFYHVDNFWNQSLLVGKTASKVTLKQLIFILGLCSARVGPKGSEAWPSNAVAPVSKSAFPAGQISHNIKSV